MAPAVTDINTKYQAQGQYKNPAGVGPSYFDKHAEENGIGEFGPAKYPHYLPIWNYDEKYRSLSSWVDLTYNLGNRYPPLEPFEHYEHGKDADASFATLLSGAKVTDITPILGAEVHGIQLSKLSDKGKDELALFVAQKKVVGKLGHPSGPASFNLDVGRLEPSLQPELELTLFELSVSKTSQTYPSKEH